MKCSFCKREMKEPGPWQVVGRPFDYFCDHFCAVQYLKERAKQKSKKVK